MFLLKNEDYTISVYNHYNNTNIYSSFSVKEEDQNFSGNIDNPKEGTSEQAYSGTMRYDKTSDKYQMYVVFKQPTWKHYIPGCGN